MGTEHAIEFALGHGGAELLLAGGEISRGSTSDRFHAKSWAAANCRLWKEAKASGVEGMLSTEGRKRSPSGRGEAEMRIMRLLEPRLCDDSSFRRVWCC